MKKYVDFSLVYPVGSIYISSTNSNPSSLFGGTWELVKKEFKDSHGSYSSEELFTQTEDVKNVYVYYTRSSNTLWIKFYIGMPKALLEEENVLVGNFNLANLGVTELTNYDYTSKVLGSDGGNGVVICTISKSGEVNYLDYNPNGETPSATSNFYCYLSIPIEHSDMIDSFCDKFFWKRTG